MVQLKLDGTVLTDKDVRKYCSLTDKSLHEIYIPTEAVSCKNVHCLDENHIDTINKLYCDIVNSLTQPVAGKQFSSPWQLCQRRMGDKKSG